MFDLAQNPLVETDWLADHLDDPDLRVVDMRWRGYGQDNPAPTGPQLYIAGHIPGAVHLDWDADLSYARGKVRNVLLPPERFAGVMTAAGIGDETRVVAYADTDHSGAARLWWGLHYYGHEQVAVLNGGLDKWLAEGRPLSTDVPGPAPARFTPRPQPRWLATTAEVEAAAAGLQAGVRLVDTRPAEQYTGRAVWMPEGSLYTPPGQDWVAVEGRPMRAGHIPGAVHLHASPNLNPQDWTYLPPEALRARAAAAGVDPQERVITYCGVGISASLGLFALYVAGYRDLALYDGSWDEWSADPTHPVERS